jgi:2-haloacid dehalogenase
VAAVAFAEFEALTFDCYGTLIDWEAGISATLGGMLSKHAVVPDVEDLLQRYAGHEAALEAGPYRRYHEILAEAARRVGRAYGVEPSPDEVGAFAASVGEWPAFPDSAAALAGLAERYRLGVITNCDDDLFAASNRRLGVTFDWIVTAEQAGSYKPDPRNFELAFARMDVPRERILHVAQSLFHDHVPAKALGLTTVWIDRRRDRQGFGATPPAEATPDLVLPDMASLAAAVLTD